MTKEIERRFVLTRLPDEFAIHQPYQVLQAYTRIDESDELEERVRFRQTPEGNYNFLRYQKRGVGQVRKETATPISSSEFHAAMTVCLGLPISKNIYYEQYQGRWIELHIFLSHRPLMTIEVEFANEADAATFVPYEWFGREVTHDRRYNSASVSLFGVPNDFRANDELVRRFYNAPIFVEP